MNATVALSSLAESSVQPLPEQVYESHRQPMGGDEGSVEEGVAVEDPSFCEAVG